MKVESAISNSFYRESEDRIYLRAQGVWGQRGIFTAAHEYGHALHEKTLGGAGGNCPDPHFLDGAHHLQCAHSEGFADFHAAVTRGPDLGASTPGVIFNFDNQIENNAYYPGRVYSGSTPGAISTDGSIIGSCRRFPV